MKDLPEELEEKHFHTQSDIDEFLKRINRCSLQITTKHTKCEMAYHFVLDWNDTSTNMQMIELVCSTYKLVQLDVPDILPGWDNGVFYKGRHKCSNI